MVAVFVAMVERELFPVDWLAEVEAPEGRGKDAAETPNVPVFGLIATTRA